MTMTLPTLPSLPAGYVVQAADLNNLAYCCTFLLTKPIVRVVDSAGGQPLGTATLISWATASYNTDSMWFSGSTSRLTVQTSGWYKIRYNIVATGSTNAYNTYVTSTTGSNNPAGAGVVSGNHWAAYSNPLSSTGGGAGASGIWPLYLYQGDYIQVYANCGSAGNSTAANASELSLEFVSLF